MNIILTLLFLVLDLGHNVAAISQRLTWQRNHGDLEDQSQQTEMRKSQKKNNKKYKIRTNRRTQTKKDSRWLPCSKAMAF